MEFKDINQILLQLNQAAAQSSLSSIEKQIILNKLASIYDEFSCSTFGTALAKGESSEVETDAVVNKVSEVVIAETVPDSIVVKDEKVEIITEKPTAEEKHEVETMPVVEQIHEMPVSIEQKPNSLLGKYENSDNTSLNQKFVGQGKGLNERVVVGDLKKAIDFNKQFVFTQELFGNDPAAYLEAINKLNQFDSIKESFDFITSELVEKYKWNMNSDTVKLFDAIIRKKFGV
jgi:hypothetical protein